LVGQTDSIPLGVVQEIGVVVGGVGEQFQSHLTWPVQFDFDVKIAHHVSLGGVAVFPVPYIAVNNHLVVEQLGGHRDIEDVVAGHI